MAATWTAWEGTRTLAFLHARVRRILQAQGVEDGFLPVDGSPVHYYAAGPASAERTVVLLHGLGDSANNWFRSIPLLAWRGDRVLAIDLPGHGFSPPADERGYLHIREHARVVREVVAAKGGAGARICLVGHSLGGWVAARAHLDGLDAERLVLVEAAGLAYEGMWDSIELLRIEKEEDLQRFFRIIMHHTPPGVNLLSREVAAMFRSPAVVNFLNGYDRHDIIPDEELESVRAQTTILWGENDGLIPPTLAHRWHAGIPGSRLVWMPRCGHAPQFERPILFQRLLEDALGHPPMKDAIRARLAQGMQTRWTTLQQGVQTRWTGLQQDALARMPEILRRRLKAT